MSGQRRGTQIEGYTFAPGESEEIEALSAMGSVLSGCVPAQTEARFTREALRSLIALAALRLVRHNSAT